jgi:flagellar hook protein FlgE
MNVVGHNIANVNTIAFKSQRMDFQDMFYNNTFGSGGLEQIGMGARIGTVLTDFSQGPMEQTGLSTDLAIQGKGWFQVRVPGQERVYYTRAGDFSLNKEGEMKSPHDYILQGWRVPEETKPIIAVGSAPMVARPTSPTGAGVPVDIKLDTWTILPRETNRITTYVNLDAKETDHSIWDANPFAALFNTWDGQLIDPVTNLPINREGRAYLPEDAFAYASPIKIYDDAGVAHTATIYFDKVEKDAANPLGKVSYDGGKASQTIWEYIVTINPAEDNRWYWDTTANGGAGEARSMQTTQMAGILMSGTLTFGSNGDLVDMSAYTLQGHNKALSDKPNASGEYTLLAHYHAVYTDPRTGATRIINPGDTIHSSLINDTAFYPDINTDTRLDVTTTLPAGGDYQAVAAPVWPLPAGGPLVEINGVIYVATGYQVTSPDPSPGGRVYNAGDPITDPADVARIQAGPPSAMTYWRVTALGIDNLVMPGYQITYDDGLGTPTSVTIYNTGDFVPAPPRPLATPPVGATITIEQLVGAQQALMSWYPADVSNSGYPLLVTNFTSVEQAHTTGTPRGKEHLVEIDFGITVSNLTQPWQNYNTSLGELRLPPSGGGPFMPYPAPNPMDPLTWAFAGNLANINGKPHISATHCMQVDGSSATVLSRQNGYTYGSLMDIYFDQSGVMYGIYSNGVTKPLYQIVLYDFVAPQHLRFEGGNLVSQTMESGDPSWGRAGSNGFGTVNGYMIEQSNVDLAKEMVHMITTQRGFQANSKVITSVDTMLEVVVNMKR